MPNAAYHYDIAYIFNIYRDMLLEDVGPTLFERHQVWKLTQTTLQ